MREGVGQECSEIDRCIYIDISEHTNDCTYPDTNN